MSFKPTKDDLMNGIVKVISERGYLVIGTKPGREPFPIGKTLEHLWEFDVEQPFTVIGYTDAADYVAQMELFNVINPHWPKIARPEYFGPVAALTFYRVITD